MSVDATDEQRSNQSDSTSAPASFGLGLAEPLRGSRSIQVALIGLVVTVVAAIVNTGVWPAIIGVWGIGLILIGIISHLAIRYSRRNSRD